MFLVGRDIQPQQLQAQRQNDQQLGDDLRLLSQEAAQYGDLLVGDFRDTFRNLAHKVKRLPPATSGITRVIAARQHLNY